MSKENQLSGLKKGNEIPVKSMLTERDTREKMAKDLEMSTGSLSKAQYIYKNSDDGTIKQLDDGNNYFIMVIYSLELYKSYKKGRDQDEKNY